MNNKQIIKNILFEELSMCNNFNYHIEIGNLYLIVNTKKLYQSLFDNSFRFEGGIDSKVLFKQYESKNLYLSYYDIWSKFEKKTQLRYIEIQSIVKDVLEEGFKLKNIIPFETAWEVAKTLEEGFKLNNIIPSTFNAEFQLPLKKGFKVKGIMPLK